MMFSGIFFCHLQNYYFSLVALRNILKHCMYRCTGSYRTIQQKALQPPGLCGWGVYGGPHQRPHSPPRSKPVAGASSTLFAPPSTPSFPLSLHTSSPSHPCPLPPTSLSLMCVCAFVRACTCIVLRTCVCVCVCVCARARMRVHMRSQKENISVLKNRPFPSMLRKCTLGANILKLERALCHAAFFPNCSLSRPAAEHE
jgi:hypothetical protein